MEKLKIVNPTALDLGESFGILPGRMAEISIGLDEMVTKASSGEIRLVYAVDIFQHILSLCNSLEEYTWAIQNHIIWLAGTGRLFTTQEVQWMAIDKFGKPNGL